MPTCGENAVALLEELGVEVVFGIPGVHTLEFYRGLGRSGVRHITPRHEQGAAFMATGYAMVSSRPGVCLLITGAGLTNAATAVASAYHDSQPLLVLSSATHSREAGRGRGALHDLPDQAQFMATITGFSQTVSEPDDLPTALRRAFDSFATGRRRPVHVGVPIDVLGRECPPPRLPDAAVSDSKPDPAAIVRAADLLEEAQSPFILLGGGAVDAGAEALRLAALTGAPIATTVNGKGAIPESHPATVSATLPLAEVYSAMVHADVLLAVGTEFSAVDYEYTSVPEPRGALVRIDIEPAQLDNGPAPTVGVCGDASTVLGAVADLLEHRGRLAGHDHLRADQLREQMTWYPGASPYFPVRYPGASPYFPVLDAIAAALPDDAIVASDSTQLAYVANNYLPINSARSYLCPAGFGTLGPALPMAIGAKIAAPDRPVACLIGDGGLLFTIAELATAAEHRLPLAILLWQNHGYGEIRDSMTAANIVPLATETTAHDYLQIAAGFGCRGTRVHAVPEIGPAIQAAFTADRPTIIELAADALLHQA